MKLKRIEINNYRNLDGVKLVFDADVNFIVGESNLGKSNSLILLNTIYDRASFYETDFYDPNEPIELFLKIELDDIELGIFTDMFDPEESDCINIMIKQESIDDNIQFYHQESGANIPPSSVKCLSYVYYDSLRNPGSELTFDKKRGVGRFLNHVFNKYMETEEIFDIDLIDRNKAEGLIEFINNNLRKIKSFSQFSISANLEEDVQNLLARVITLKDEKNINLQSSGYGVQFLSMICLTIFEKLLLRSRYKKDKGVFEDDDGLKYIPFLLGLDEPEIHLHPYMQRSLVKYLINILSNEDSDFLEVLSGIFSINKFIGQLIITTHSPNIILSDYRQIIRFFKDSDGEIAVRNGQEIILDKQLEKHLAKNMPHIKEAFFSRCVILVEGDTELGAMPVFAKKLNIDLDECGISIIQAGSADSIPPLIKLLNEFGIKNIGLMDGDKHSVKYDSINGLHFTECQDIEQDIVERCLFKNREAVLKAIVKKYDSVGLARSIEKKKVNSIIKKYDLDVDDFDDNHDFNTNKIEILYPIMLAWMDINKSIILGRTIAEILPISLIPGKVKTVLYAALEESRYV